MKKLLLLGIFFYFPLSGFDFSNNNSGIFLNDANSNLKITSPENYKGWKRTSIAESISPNKLFLSDNSEWLNVSGDWLAVQDSFELTGDLIVPDQETIYITNDIQIDGRKNNLILGHQVNFLLDAGVTLTLKNLTLKNGNVGKISPYPFQVKADNSKIVLDDVSLNLNGNLTFTKGMMFIHDDVKVTGSTEFVYSSPDYSFIEKGSKLYFSPGTSLFYNQDGVSVDMDLLVMQDKTSVLHLNAATLRTTDTGLRLTKGRLYLDNKVTLSGYTKVPQTYSNGLIFGDFLLGSEYDLSVYLNSGARLNLYGKLLEDSASNGINFANKSSYIVLSDDNSKFKITNADSLNGWRETAIIKPLPENTLFLTDNQEWGTISGNWIPPQESFELLNDLKIADNQTIFVAEDIQIDGKNNNLILGQNSGFLVDSGVTLTLKNLILKNDNLGEISPHPFQVKSNNSKIVLDDVILNLNGSLSFTKGSLFFHDDVKINGTTEFIYSSPDYSFIEPFSSLYFSPGTSFYYNQDGVTANIDLMKMQDETSIIYLNGATLKTTDTGLRLTKGALYLDNNVTFSSYLRIPQTYSNGLIFGDSLLGSDYDLNVYLNSGARVDLYGKLWEDSYSDGLTFVNKNSYISLSDANSKFKITNSESLNGWRETAIIKPLPESSLFLTNNQEWGTTSGSWIPPQESFELISDFIIPDNQTVIISDNLVIEGNNNSLILGHRSQLLIDENVTVTLKNLKIKNSLNTISQPPIKCLGWFSQLCLDNVKFLLKDDFAFGSGQLFIHDDVEITGTSKFSYRSARSSYIADDSSLIFSPKTTFEYFPNSTNNSLIQMQSETSLIDFNNSTLQTTHTGIRLTKGMVYLDNKVTLSSSDDFLFSTLLTTTGWNYGAYVRAVAWSPDGLFIAIAGYGQHTGDVLQLYAFDGNNLTFVDSYNYGLLVNNLNWSRDGKYLVVAGQSGEGVVVLSFDGSSLTKIDLTPYGTRSFRAKWSNDGKYIAVAGINPIGNNEIVVYYFDGTSLTVSTSRDFGPTGTSESYIYGLDWSADCQYLAVGGYKPTNENELQVYSFTDGVLSENPISSRDYGDASASAQILDLKWSPDNNFLAVAGANPASGDELQIYSVIDGVLSTNPVDSRSSAGTRSMWALCWSPCGSYLAIGEITTGLKIYSFSGGKLSTNTIYFNAVGSQIYSIDWTADREYFALGIKTPVSGNELQIYNVDYMYDDSIQLYRNGIIFGYSELGPEYDLDVYLNSGARVELYGKLWEDSYSDGLTFANKNSYISLADAYSKFKITNPESLNGWRETAIINPLLESNNLFLTNNQEWVASSNSQLSPQESFQLTGDLIIPDNEIIFVGTDIQIDGRNNSLIFGHNSNIFVDSGVTLTLKNMSLKNETLGKISPYPFQVKSNDSTIVLDDVYLSLNGNISFTLGSLFIHDDVSLTGSIELIYSSPDYSFIEPHSSLYFYPGTSFYYNQDNVSTNTTLLVMRDETSAIYLNGATLRTTNTGLRLTTGRLYLDNNVTLSSYSRGIIFGDSSLGSDCDLNVYFYGGARVDVYGTLWNDCVGSVVHLTNKNNFISLADADSKFKITNPESLIGWRETAIIRSLAENNLFFTDNQEWITTDQITPQESFNLISDFIIPDNEIVNVGTDIQIDGKSNNLIMGHNSRFLVDSGITLTLKNLTLKNENLGKVSPYPFQVKDNNSKIVLDNVYLNLNGNLTFTKGSLFIHDDVLISGSSELIYSSPDYSFIEPNSKLHFRNGTSFYYNQAGVSDNMQLIQLQDSTSEIFLDGATLRTTDTGLRLTKGKLYLDNKITLSSYLRVPQTYSNGLIFGDSDLGSEYNLNISILSAARVEVFGKLCYDEA